MSVRRSSKAEVVIMKYELGEVQKQFAEIVWEKEPIGSGELVKICDKEFGWKKSTTYTVLKKLCEKGIFQNMEGVVTSIITKADFYAATSEQFVEETFGGSFPAFIAAFTSGKKLTEQEVEEIQKMIDEFKK